MAARRLRPRFRSILCAVDFSVHSRQALQYAAAVAKRFGGRVTVLIVIGTQALSGVQKLVFGSTTEQVLRRTTIPVLAVPPQSTRRSRSHRPLTVDAIIVPIDLAGEWASDAVRGAVIARMFNVPIRL